MLLIVVAASGGRMVTNAAQIRPLCSALNGQAWPLGVTIVHNERFFRCLTVFDAKMNPSGAAWVEVEKQATRWVTPRAAQ